MMKKIFLPSLAVFLPSLLLATPTTPTNLHLQALSSSAVVLSWQNNATDNSGHKIFRNGVLIGISPKGINSYTDHGLNPYTTYKYTLKATDDAQNYEDAEGASTTKWSVYTGVGSIHNVYDTQKGSHVIELQGDGINTSYKIGHYPNGTNAWNNNDAKAIRWSMNFSENFTVYVLVTTVNGGVSYLYYRPHDQNYQADSGNILHGLGTSAMDGTWQTFSRDLNADLKDFEPDNEIASVEGIIIRGSGKLDDITLYTESLVPIFIIGESTVNYERMGLDLQGWAQKIDQYMKNPSRAYNRARAGSVAGTMDPDPNHRSYDAPGPLLADGTPYHSDNYWSKTKNEILSLDRSNGGFLLIQFGGNDDHENIPYADYRANLKHYIDEARALNITPVLVTTTAARMSLGGNFGRDEAYINEKTDLAEQEGVLLLDLYHTLGAKFTNSTQKRLGYQYGNHAYANNDGTFFRVDQVHTEQRGAYLVAGIIRDLACDTTLVREASQTIAAQKLCAQFDQSVKTTAENFYSTAQNIDDPSDFSVDGWSVQNQPDLANEKILRVAGIGNDVVTSQPDMDIHLNGNNRDFFFIHGSSTNNADSWNNTTQHHLKWDMNFDNIQFYLWVETEDGERTFYYDQRDEDRGIHPDRPHSIRFGLGSDAVGSWHTFTRNLNADLRKFEPTNHITVVKGIGVYGNGLIDNVKMY